MKNSSGATISNHYTNHNRLCSSFVYTTASHSAMPHHNSTPQPTHNTTSSSKTCVISHTTHDTQAHSQRTIHSTKMWNSSITFFFSIPTISPTSVVFCLLPALNVSIFHQQRVALILRSRDWSLLKILSKLEKINKRKIKKIDRFNLKQ